MPMHVPAQHKEDWLLTQRCASGDEQAFAQLTDQYEPVLQQMLIRRGAARDEVDDLVAGLWADCVPGDPSRPSLLEKYNGTSSLHTWLVTIMTRRLIDHKRRRRIDTVTADFIGDESAGGAMQLAETAVSPAVESSEDFLLELLCRSVRNAFAQCPASDELMLRLVHVHGLTQREICQIWGWSETKVSRSLTRSTKWIREETLRQVALSDPWLALTWQDFIDLCDSHEIGLF